MGTAIIPSTRPRGTNAGKHPGNRQTHEERSHSRGRPRIQNHDAQDINRSEPTDDERFDELADRWERETVLLSNSSRAARHPAHREIVGMGEIAVPLILERMRSQGRHWFQALRDITGADPVKPEDRGNVASMQASWLDWGKLGGLV